MESPSFYSHKDVFTDPSIPIAIRKSKQPSKVPIHTHDFTEIVIVLSGSAIHKLSSHGNASSSPHELFPGDVVVIPPGKIHSYLCTHDFIIYNIMFFKDYFLEKKTQLIDPFGKFQLDRNQREAIEANIYQIDQEQNKKDLGYKTIITNRFAELLILLSRFFKNSTHFYSHYYSTLETIDAIYRSKRFIEDNYQQKLTLSEIANSACMSTHYFCEQFKKKVGVTPISYLNKTRIRTAKKLFSQPEILLSNISSEVGFCSYPHFSRIFKKYEGISPQKYKQKKEYSSKNKEYKSNIK